MFEENLKKILEQKNARKSPDVYSFRNPDLSERYFKLWWEYLTGTGPIFQAPGRIWDGMLCQLSRGIQ